MAAVGDTAISGVSARVYRIPTDALEADGTYAWDATTLVVVHNRAGDQEGLGYTYSDASIVSLIEGLLARAIRGRDCFDIGSCFEAMQMSVRNIGRSGLAASAISAIDTALWDLKARILGLPLACLLGQRRERVMIYGSGGFTSYSDAQLTAQLERWVEVDGCHAVKMKIGSDPEQDPARVRVARAAIGDKALFVDANGAFSVTSALRFLSACVEYDIRWFEEPVTSDDLAGLRRMRGEAPGALDIAAGEYIFTLDDARLLLGADVVDVLQADVTRCGGIAGFLRIADLCEAHHIGLSGHCVPSLHLHVASAAPRLRHLEWFHDHVRIEHMLFDGAPVARDGAIAPDPTRPGHGLTLKRADAEAFAIRGG